MKQQIKQTKLAILVAIGFFMTANTMAAGLLKPVNGGNAVSMKSHTVNVLINNGYARTEVDQVFFNTSDQDLEAIYTFPVPKEASLSELSMWINGQEVIGEVVEKQQAKQIYEEQKAAGNDTALAEKDDYRAFNVNVYPVRAGAETRIRLVYYQPVRIDLNIGRYVYPLEEGNVDEERLSFWSVDNQVHESFAFNLKLISAFPVKEVRMPQHQDRAIISRSNNDENSGIEVIEAAFEDREGTGNLGQDVVFYYRLDDQAPARVEIIPFKEKNSDQGTFMAIVTPGADLQRITSGVDWTFVLDVSGSMDGNKIMSLAKGVERALGKMNANDRYRIVIFNDRARLITNGFVPATEGGVQNGIDKVMNLKAGGGTNLFEGISTGLYGLEQDRISSIILVTDGVANVGPSQHRDFINLLKRQDVRIFTFVIGNGANQPLLDRIAKDSGGFAMNLSPADDIAGRLVQAKAKVIHECIYGARLDIKGAGVTDVTPPEVGNLYMGQQLIVFGHYDKPGTVEMVFSGKLAGERKTWTCKAVLPDEDTDNPEIERLWALACTDVIMEDIRENGETDDLKHRIVDLGTTYSLVTDYTSMVILDDETSEKYGIRRNNRDRVERERMAAQSRPAKSYRADQHDNGMFQGKRSHGVGSGPVGPAFVLLSMLMAAARRKD